MFNLSSGIRSKEALPQQQTKVDDSLMSRCSQSIAQHVFHDPATMDGRMTKAMTVVLLVLAIITVLMNLGVIIRIRKLFKRGRDLSPAFYFIGNLAVSDFLVGLYVIIVFCIDLSQFSTNWRDKCCGLLTAIVVSACQETICNVTIIAIDKYIFICHGLTYRRIVTRRRVWMAIFITWFFSILIGFLPSFGLHENNWCSCNFLLYINKAFSVLLFITAVVLPFSIILVLYSIILSLAIKVTKKRLEGMSSGSTGGFTSVIRLSLKLKSSKSSKSTIRSKSSNNSATSSTIVSSDSEQRPGTSKKTGTRADNYTTKAERTPSSYEVPTERTPLKNDLNKNMLEISTLSIVHEAQEDKEESHKSNTNVGSNSDVSSTSDVEVTLPADYDRINSNSTESRRIGDSKNKKVHGSYDFLNTSANNNPSELNVHFQDDVDNVAGNLITLKSYKQFNEDKPIEQVQIREANMNKINVIDEQEIYVQPGNRNNVEEVTEEIGSDVSDGESPAPKMSARGSYQWRRRSYYKKIVSETKDKVLFLKKCRAIKAIFLIVFSFAITYVPFVTGTFAYKIQNDTNQRLYQALNNLLYCAVVINSILNPFVYAYGYKEFRIQTKRFRGILGTERRRDNNF